MAKKTIRIIRIEADIKTNRTYKSFKKEFPDFKYDRKTKTYTLPPRVIKEIKKSFYEEEAKEKRERIIQAQIEQEQEVKEKKEKQETLTDGKRIRKQFQYYYADREYDNGDIAFANIIVATLSPFYNMKALIEVANKERRKLEAKYDITLDKYGTSEQEIDEQTDIKLNDGKIHIQTIVNGIVTNYTY